jgi:hypothetical protein
MPVFDPMDAISLAQQNLSGKTPQPKFNSVSDYIKSLGPQQPVSNLPAPFMSPVTGNPQLDKGIQSSVAGQVVKTATQTPGTLEHNMASLDSHYGQDPQYLANRDTIKYHLQRIIDVSPDDIITKKDAINTAVGILQGGMAQKGPMEMHPELYTAPDDTSIDGNSSIFDIARHFADEDGHPGRKTNFLNRVLAYANAVPTPEIAGKDSPAYLPGKFLQGGMSLFNPATYISSAIGIPQAIGGIVARQLVPGDQGHVGPPVDAPPLGQDIAHTFGLDDAGNVAQLLGMLVTGHLVAPALKGATSVAKDLPGPDVAETVVPTGEDIPAAKPMKGAKPTVAIDGDNGGTVQATSTDTPVIADSTPMAKPKTVPLKGSRHADLRALIEQVTGEPEAETAAPESAPTQPAPAPQQSQAAPGLGVFAQDPNQPAPLALGDSSAQHPRGGEWTPVQNSVVPLDDLIASHDHSTYAENPDYPQELQPRDRTQGGLKEQVLENASKLDKNGEISTDFRATDRGAPIVGPDGVVEAGNGRTMSMRLARDMQNPAWLAYQEKVMGMHPDAANMKDPVLVRMRTNDLTPDQRVDFANQANGRAAAAATRVEAARTDAGILDGPTIDSLADTGGSFQEAIKSPQNDAAVQKFLNNLDPSEARALVKDQAGAVERMTNAARARILGPGASDVLSRIVQDGDFGRRIVAGIDRATIPLLKAVRATETGEVSPDLDFRNTFGEALRIVDDYKGSDNKAGFWDQGRMDEPDPNAMALARALVSAPSQGAVEAVLEHVASKVSGASDGGMFDDAPPAKSLSEVFSDLPMPKPKDTKGIPADPFKDTPILRPSKGARSVRPGMQAAGTDLRALAAVAAAGGLGLAVANSPAIKDWYRKNGLLGVAEAGALGVGTLGLLYAGMTGKLTPGVEGGSFKFANSIMSPRELARQALASPDKAAHLFGAAMDDLTTAKGAYTYHMAVAAQRIGAAAAEAFGTKDFLKNDAFLKGNDTVRDVMETNVHEGRPWDEGLTPEWKKFVTQARSIMDEALTAAESEGIRVRVTNDGTQHLKLSDGDSVRVKGGELGTYRGFERAPGPAEDATDPFTTTGGFKMDPAPGNLSQSELVRAANRRVTPEAPPVLNVEMGDGSMRQIAPGETFGRPVDRIGDSFVPRVLKPDFVESLQTLDAQPPEYRAALANMLGRMNPTMGLSGDKMMGTLADIAGSMELTDSNVSAFMANLEKERMWDLAKVEWTDAEGKTHTIDPYQSSYIDSVSTYLDRAWKRVGIAQQFGPDPNALGGVIGEIGRKNPAYGATLEKFVGRALGIGPERPGPAGGRTAARIEGAYQSLSKLSVTTPLRQADDLIRSLTVAGGKNVLGSMYDLIFSPDKGEMRATGDALSAAREQWLSDLRFGKDNPGMNPTVGAKVVKGVKQLASGNVEGLTSLADAVMTVTGIRGADIAVKRVAAITGLRDATDALDSAASAVKAAQAIPDAVASKLAWYGIPEDTVHAAAAGGDARAALMADPKAMAQVGANIREKMLHTGAVEDNPLWTSDPVGSVIMRFKKPAYVATRFLLTDVLGEAAQGNLKPLVRFVTYGVGLGTGTAYLKGIINAQGMDPETRRLWNAGDHAGAIKRFFTLPATKTFAGALYNHFADPKTGPTAVGLLGAATHGLYDAGSLGLPGDMFPQLNSRVKELTGNPSPNPWDAAMPVTYTEISDLLKRFGQAYKGGEAYGAKVGTPVPNPTYEGMERGFKEMTMGAAAFEQLRSSFTMARKMTDLLDIKPDLVRLHDLESLDRTSGGQLPRATYVEMARLKSRVEGKYADLARDVKEDRGSHQSLKTEVFSDMGVEASGARKKVKGIQ